MTIEQLNEVYRLSNTLLQENSNLRVGQCYMIALCEIDSNLYHEIIGTEADCFYDNTRTEQFYEFLNSKVYNC